MTDEQIIEVKDWERRVRAVHLKIYGYELPPIDPNKLADLFMVLSPPPMEWADPELIAWEEQPTPDPWPADTPKINKL